VRDAFDHLGSGAGAAGERDEGVAGGVEGLALDAGLTAGTRPELGAALLGVVHEPLEVSALSASDDEVCGARLATVCELEAFAAPPGELAAQLGVDRDVPRVLALSSLRLKGLTVVLRGELDAAQSLDLLVDIAPSEAADLTLAHAREQRQRGEDARLGL